MTHTPGPWEKYKKRDRFWGIREVNGNPRYAEIVDTYMDDAVVGTEADASLISGAPDMLEALEGVVRVADRNTVEFAAARAAIAKARGQS